MTDRTDMMSEPDLTRDVPGIARGPAIDPEVLAVLAAAVDQVWPRPRVVVAEEPATMPAWRFSGRWWSRPAAVRRDRPRVRHSARR